MRLKASQDSDIPGYSRLFPGLYLRLFQVIPGLVRLGGSAPYGRPEAAYPFHCWSTVNLS